MHSQELGVEIKFLEIDWNKKIIELNSGNIDLIWNGMTILDSLKTEMEISNPYMSNKQVCVVKKENASKYNSLDAMKGANFTYELGSSAETWAINNGFAGDFSGKNTQMMAMTDVLSGSSDVAVVDLLLANFYTTSNSSFANLIPTITLKEEGKTLFCGVATGIGIVCENGIYYLEAEAVSWTIKLDCQRKKRSFQEKGLSYYDIAKRLAKEAGVTGPQGHWFPAP